VPSSTRSMPGGAHAVVEQFDETLAHQDYQLGRLVERLKETGEW
jgi:hypothetical protein